MLAPGRPWVDGLTCERRDPSAEGFDKLSFEALVPERRADRDPPPWLQNGIIVRSYAVSTAHGPSLRAMRCIEQGSSPFAFQPKAVRSLGPTGCGRRCCLAEVWNRVHVDIASGHAELARGSATREANLRGGETVQLRV